ncbi:hypothetical protein DNHGIG_17140 [Collibacillus ludicampi]|uniref:YbbR-like domain-containing protein n=1 Tax=Collibacillus ludicampi TaxID=2771369 RepID=A0AAV4LEC3_9BACL|nr:CdaR family protein [Collibacillus ludicampi]GIM46165.1 hypothetical protein DNHGIG_17140 [Collibacillus ludicampi]
MDSFLKNNNVVRVIALVLAVMVWLIVKGSPEDTSTGFAVTVSDTVTHDVTVLYDRNRVALVEPPPSVKLTLHGDRMSIMQAKWATSLWNVTVDARNIGPGEYFLPVTVEGLPHGVVADPVQVKVVLAPIQSRQFDVQAKTEGELEPGYTLGSITTSPSQVNITGTPDQLAHVKKVEARVRLRKGDTGTLKRKASVFALDESGQPVDVSIDPQTVDATVVITAQGNSFPLQVQLQGKPKDGYVIDAVKPSVASVSVVGSLQGQDKYTVPLDVSGLSETRTFSVKLPLLPGVTQVVPDTVDIQVVVTPPERRTFTNVPIQVTNLADDYTADLSSKTVDIVVEGEKKSIDALKPEDVQAVVDLSGQGEGTQQVSVQANIRSDAASSLRVVDVKNSSVQVTIRKKSV